MRALHIAFATALAATAGTSFATTDAEAARQARMDAAYQNHLQHQGSMSSTSTHGTTTADPKKSSSTSSTKKSSTNSTKAKPAAATTSPTMSNNSVGATEGGGTGNLTQDAKQSGTTLKEGYKDTGKTISNEAKSAEQGVKDATKK